MYKDVLQQNQGVVYQVLKNALTKNRVAHAYLLVGEHGTGTKETAYLLAQSLLCNQSGFACETCTICTRVARNEYTDFIYIDGKDRIIKKKEIMDLQEIFAKTALEQVGKKVYIIDHVENMHINAINALLKFLEEPSSSIVAILIAENMERVLPTIISRCQVLHFKPLSAQNCFLQIKDDLDELDAYLLSKMYRNKQEIIEISESDEYQHGRYMFINFVEKYLQSPYDALLFLQIDGINGKVKKEQKICFRYFIDLLLILFKDAIKNECSIANTWYNTYMHKLHDKDYDFVALQQVIMQTKDKLVGNINLALLADQLVYKMKEVAR